MCGISGIIKLDKSKVEETEIQAINNLISHRGPDSEGFYLKNNFAFGHRRLSILDLSAEGHQPMTFNNKYTITYNGEVYNYIEIRQELEKLGYKFKSNTDTEVILASYDKWGEDCVKKFNGMWSFAIYDSKRDIVFCSRDRFGIKPFYYTTINNRFVFGSEIKQLLHFKEDRKVNINILMDYIVLGFQEHTNETFFKGILKLEQSHNLIFNLKDNTFKINRYYDIKLNKKLNKFNLKNSVHSYKEQLIDAVKLRLRSDVKVGTCLSGGLDSSSITAIASEYYNTENRKLIAIHAKSTEKDTDESYYAKEVGSYCNVDLKTVTPTSSDFLENIDEVITTQEEPFGSPSVFMQYFVMKKARELGCTVMLDGQGGDETLLGYERYYPAYLKKVNFKTFFKSSKNSRLSLKELFFYIMYFTNSNVRMFRLKRKFTFLKKEYIDKVNKNLLRKSSKSYLNIFKLQYNEIYSLQLPHLLKYEDKNSMRNSIETRLPFIDYKLLETALSINDEYKIKEGWTKYILRKVINSYLPKKVVWRKNKLGFNAPENSWISELKEQMLETLSDSKILANIYNKKVDYSKLDKRLIWKLYNIAKWEKIFNVKM